MSILNSLISSTETPAVTLIPVSASDLNDWRDDQTPRVQSWLNHNAFDATPGSYCSISNEHGQLIEVVVGIAEELDLWACAHLPMLLPQGVYKLDSRWPEASLTAISLGWALGSYQFSRYKKPKRAPAKLLLDPACKRHSIEAQAAGIELTRDLINTPAQDMMPQHLAEETEKLAKLFNAQFSQIVGDELLQNNYPVIHAVGRASAHAPRLLDLRWGNKQHPKLTLVGKGVCFDSGGLDLKPASGMRWMKKDMGGAAHVLGLASMIMASGLPVCLRVLIPAVDNAVSGDAFRPGDVLTSRSGKTIEIDNTDAEGRLVLCDALSEAITDEPDLLIDMATLTGAARVALGPDVPALFAQRTGTAQALLEHSAHQHDPLWHMPLHQPYKRWINSDIADLVNSAGTPLGGAITAALFLQAFVPSKLDWLHMDVMAFNNEALPGRPRGGEAMALRGFFAYLRQRYGG